MDKRFFIALGVVTIAIAVLVYGAVNANAKSVVTVSELAKQGGHRNHIRLGARVAEGDIEFLTKPEPRVNFSVHDIIEPQTVIAVSYLGMMPDTLMPGRDVILEGDFNNGVFVAKTLLTQCPSKYKPPTPDGTPAVGTPAVGAPAAGGYQ